MVPSVLTGVDGARRASAAETDETANEGEEVLLRAELQAGKSHRQRREAERQEDVDRLPQRTRCRGRQDAPPMAGHLHVADDGEGVRHRPDRDRREMAEME